MGAQGRTFRKGSSEGANEGIEMKMLYCCDLNEMREMRVGMMMTSRPWLRSVSASKGKKKSCAIAERTLKSHHAAPVRAAGTAKRKDSAHAADKRGLETNE